MKQQFGLILITVSILTFLLGLGIAQLVSLETLMSSQPSYWVLGVLAFTLIGAGFGVHYFAYTYIGGVSRLVDEMKIILNANVSHRVTEDGPGDMRRLTETINAFADRVQSFMDNQATQIQKARADLEDERNRLAALMSELTEGVLVCNTEGRILLYNNRARHLLSQERGGSWAGRVGGFVGLGRSIFGLIDRNTITQALDDLAYRLEKEEEQTLSQFVTTATNGQLVRVRIAPIVANHEKMNGFILTVEDITQRSERSQRRDLLLRTLTERVRSSLANIRTAIETIEQFPQMDDQKLAQLRKVIYNESLDLTVELKQVSAQYDSDLQADWGLEEMLANDLLWAIQRHFEDKLEVSTSMDDLDENLWLKIDSYAIVRAATFIMGRLKRDFGVMEVKLCLQKTGQLAALDLVWQDGHIDMDTLWSWQNEKLPRAGWGPSLTLREMAERHGGEVWCQVDKLMNLAYFRLLLPTTQPKQIRPPQPPDETSRPEYYDFELFQQPGQGQPSELDHVPLMELSYTVFDTETTGLDPSAGDEIISISAIRIVNRRLLRQEIFDQLVDPQRPLSPASIDVHGISPEMLEGQPIAEQVLPLFHRFTEGTVLVAHNAAFDMRLLQLKEVQTGVKFTNPVLDTLLLSAVLHPNQKDHSLEAIAQRLGIKIIGRHTSLGDAILTAEIFLKLMALLDEQGIVTLADARNAAEKTILARLSY